MSDAHILDGQAFPEELLQSAKHSNWPDPSVYQYVLDTVTYPREHQASRELRELTRKRFNDFQLAQMVPPDEAQLLQLLVKMSGAKKAIELGVLAGYSLLNIALALPPDGKVIGVDYGDDFELGRHIFEKAGVAHKVDFRKSKAIEVLDSLLEQGEEGSFDFAFVDADKEGYVEYHERLLKLLRVGGVIAYDNTLFVGLVGGRDPWKLLEKFEVVRSSLKGVLEFNKVIANDKRVEMAMLNIGDGVTICTRIE